MALLVPFPDFSASLFAPKRTAVGPTAATATETPATMTTATATTATTQERARAMPDVMAFIAAGKLIDAIKEVRQRTGVGLKEAHDVVREIAASEVSSSAG